MTNPAPEGWHTVTPRMFVSDVAAQVEFLKRVFGATGDVVANRPAEIRIGDSIVMVSGTDQRDPMPACLYVYVADTDEVYRLAMDAGATSLEEPRDVPYGERRAMVSDAWNNLWQIATPTRR